MPTGKILLIFLSRLPFSFNLQNFLIKEYLIVQF